MPEAATTEPLVDVTDVHTHFPIQKGVLRRTVGWIRAVDGVDMTIAHGETVGLVGESGSGKSTFGRTLLRLVEPRSGSIRFDGSEILGLGSSELKALRRQMQLIFQDTAGSLNPRMKVSQLVEEGLLAQTNQSASERADRVTSMVERVGLSTRMLDRFPHQLSGGQRQRVGIARALVLEPRFLVADEPVSALDVSVQAQILNLLVDLRREFNLTYLFVAHDIGVVSYIADRVAVMYLGGIVEVGDVDDVCSDPQHPYTQALISAVPSPDGHVGRERIVLQGQPPGAAAIPSGCRFHPRCPIAEDMCSTVVPVLETKADGRRVACHLVS